MIKSVSCNKLLKFLIKITHFMWILIPMILNNIINSQSCQGIDKGINYKNQSNDSPSNLQGKDMINIT